MTYYRVAQQMDHASTLQWKSTTLSSLDALFAWLRLYRAFPVERLRVFSSASREELGEQLQRERQGLLATSSAVGDFLRARRFALPEAAVEAEIHATVIQQGVAVPSTAKSLQGGGGWSASTLGEPGLNILERRREALESGEGGDHDIPYTLALPSSMPLVLAWTKLLAKVQIGILQS